MLFLHAESFLWVQPGNFRDLFELANDIRIAFAVVGQHAGAAILDAAFRVAEVAATAVLERIERAITEQAVEILWRIGLMAGEIFAFGVLEKGILAFFGDRLKRIGF